MNTFWMLWNLIGGIIFLMGVLFSAALRLIFGQVVNISFTYIGIAMWIIWLIVYQSSKYYFRYQRNKEVLSMKKKKLAQLDDIMANKKKIICSMCQTEYNEDAKLCIGCGIPLKG